MKCGIYREDGGKAVVEILSNTSDAEWLRYKLKILRVERQPYLGRDWEAGLEFDVEHKRGIYFGGMWDLAFF